MEKLITSNAQLRRFIPNVVHEVDDESTLFAKLTPFLDSEQDWLETNISGPETQLSEAHAELAAKIIAARAFAKAVPSLDLVVTPNGFGVVSTREVAPASKERVERLIQSLVSYADANLDVLVSVLFSYPGWRDTSPGRYFSGTLLNSLSDISRWRQPENILVEYGRIRHLAISFERELEEKHLGVSLMEELRALPFRADTPRDDYDILRQLVRAAESRWIDRHLHDDTAVCPDPHEVWHLIRPVIDRLRYMPVPYSVWLPEMGALFDYQPFKNDMQGGYWF